MEYEMKRMMCSNCASDEFEIYLVNVKEFGDMPPFDFPNYRCKNCGMWVVDDNDDAVGFALSLMFKQMYDVRGKLIEIEDEDDVRID